MPKNQIAFAVADIEGVVSHKKFLTGVLLLKKIASIAQKKMLIASQ